MDLTAIKRNLEAMCCENCNENPVVSISNSNLQIKCCCNDFRKKVQAEIKPQSKNEFNRCVNKIHKTAM